MPRLQCCVDDSALPSTEQFSRTEQVSRWKDQAEAEIDAWFEQRLALEKATFLSRLQVTLDHKLVVHHSELLEEVKGHIVSKSGAGHTCASPRPTPHHLTFFSLLDPPSKDESSSDATDPPVIFDKTGSTWTGGETERTITVSERRQYKSDYIENLVHHKKSMISFPFWRNVVSHHYFELVSWLLILLNMFVMGLEVQYIGCRLGRSVGSNDCISSLLNPTVEMWFNISAASFCVIFGIELVLRVASSGSVRAAMRSGWLWFDMLVLAFGIVDAMNRLGTPLSLVINPMVMRTTRMFRLFRLVKFLRAQESFHLLFLLMKSLLASRHALVWSVLIMFFTMTSVGLVMNQLIYTYLSDTSMPEEDRLQIYDYFGTTSRMLITMFEITLGNWAVPSRLLMDNVGQWWGLFIAVYRCWFCFSLVHVTAAVFITETSRVALDDEVQMLRKQKTDKRMLVFVRELFREINTANNGVITVDEMRAAWKDDNMKSLMQLLDVDSCVHDADEIFVLMDSGEGRVSEAEFVQGMLHLRGNAKNSKQVALMKMVKRLEQKVDKVVSDVGVRALGPDPGGPTANGVTAKPTSGK